MAIDLNSCDGCGACVVACNIENNVPIVGKDQVIRAREMHWLRIDRYYTGTVENPDVVFQPMLCQHCDNAPCENVCPVAATNHSNEGLNQMAYNRCIGTRYCANNCPYKVRRFNWYDYQQADAFDKQYGTSNDQNVASETLGLHEPLTRMVLNPDVTVRSRGVMEKCSFCVQRLQSAKLEAKKENRVLGDGEATTACQTACATGAIIFGDRNDKNSEVLKAFEDKRTFGVIEEIHTMPNVVYLTQVRNREETKQYEIIDYYHES
jgi:molybdopterin-containing oxidoreductase family iron-sulfur binding subunit